MFAHKDMEKMAKKHFTSLTNRESEIVGYWLIDKDSKFIANCLNISDHTVRTCIRTIHFKLGVNSKAALILLLFSKVSLIVEKSI